jgi:hypothetical protein
VDLAQSTNYQILVENTGADADLGCSGYLHLFNPSSTTYVKHFISTTSMTNGVLPRALCYRYMLVMETLHLP